MSNFIKRILSAAILIPAVYYFISNGSLLMNLFIIFCFLISCYEWYSLKKNFFLQIIGLIFLILSFYIFYLLSTDIKSVAFLIIICVSTDIGGYIFGKVFKGPKLTKISPNKTYAGVFGGYFLSFISLFVLNNYFVENIIVDVYLVVTTFLISTVSQIGDIIISFFKRQSKIKNTGKLIPGHGGILDRIDGMIFAVHIFYLLKLIGFTNL